MARTAVAKATGIDASNVTMHPVFLGGGFGRRLTEDYFIQAGRIAKATGYPVKMIWSREEDTAHDFYRPAGWHHFKAGLDDAGHARLDRALDGVAGTRDTSGAVPATPTEIQIGHSSGAATFFGYIRRAAVIQGAGLDAELTGMTS